MSERMNLPLQTICWWFNQKWIGWKGDESVHNKAIPEGYMDPIFNRLTISDPRDRYMRVFMEIIVHFGHKGMNGFEKNKQGQVSNQGRWKWLAIRQTSVSWAWEDEGRDRSLCHWICKGKVLLPNKNTLIYLKNQTSPTAFFQRCNPH